MICRTDDSNVNTSKTFHRQRIDDKPLANEFPYIGKTHTISEVFKVITIHSVYLITKNVRPTDKYGEDGYVYVQFTNFCNNPQKAKCFLRRRNLLNE